MLLAISTLEYNDLCLAGYRIYDTLTDTSFFCNLSVVSNLMQRHAIANLRSNHGEIFLNKEWQCRLESMRTSSRIEVVHDCIYVGYLNNKYKIVIGKGATFELDEIQFRNELEAGHVLNSTKEIVDGQETYRAIDSEDFGTPDTFRTQIEKEYNSFVAKAKLIGKPLEFTYEIRGKNVILLKAYNYGESIILPGFIKAIKKGAFRKFNIENVQLNDGLKVIGESAFESSNIQSVELPKSVDLFAGSSFYKYTKILRSTNIGNQMAATKYYN